MDDLREDDLREELGSLRLEKEKMEIKFSKTVSDHSLRYQELKDELDQTVKDKARLQEELDLKTEEVKQLFLEIQGLERTNQEDLLELPRAKSDRKHLMEIKNVWEERMNKITEDKIIQTLLDDQKELEDHLDRKTAVLDAFSARVSELVKNTRRIIEGGEDENVRSGDGDDEMGNVILVMTSPLEAELKAIEAAAFGRRSEPLAVMDGWGVGNSGDREW